MLTIKTTGLDDYLDGSANIKALIIGGPGVGKTRMSSYWPKPIYLDAENGRGSLTDRNMPYAEIKSSKDMLDALEYLKALERTPKNERQFQTVVVDTVDSFQRLVKDEWVTANRAGSFSGYDAWGYLDTKIQMLFTRLLNLDYNVVVLVHFKDKTHKDGDATIREFGLQLQGAITDQIFNDFDLVGWLGKEWAAVDGKRTERRVLTFKASPDKPFLKDRFNATPEKMDIVFAENDYQQLFEAFFNRPEFESMPESTTVGEIPDANVASTGRPVQAPHEGGPVVRTGQPGTVAPRQPAEQKDPVAAPLERKTVADLTRIAKEQYGLNPKGNTLKGELISMIRAAQDGESPSTSTSGASESPEGSRASQATDPSSSPPTPESTPSQPTTTEHDPAGVDLAVARVAATLGGEVISSEPADAPVTPQSAPPSTPVAQPASAPQGPSACADCGEDLSSAWLNPAKKNEMRLGFIKHRRYLCSSCLSK